MKLRNKLIPLLSAATIATTITPIITSCSSNGLVDITTKYIPTIEKAAKTQEALTDAQAQDLYFEHLAKNPDILRQDILSYESNKMPSRIKEICFPDGSETQQFVVNNVTANVAVSGTSARKVETVVDNEKVMFYALSCKVHYIYSYTALSVDSRESKTINFEFTATLKDIPTEVVATTYFNPTRNLTERRWSISNNFLNRKYLKAVPGWSYTYSKDQTTTTTFVTRYGETRTDTKNDNKSGIINRDSQIVDLIALDPTCYDYFSEYLRFESYHLSNIVPSEAALTGFKLALNDNRHFTCTYDYNKETGTVSNIQVVLMNLDAETATKLKDTDFSMMIGGVSSDEDSWSSLNGTVAFTGDSKVNVNFPLYKTNNQPNNWTIDLVENQIVATYSSTEDENFETAIAEAIAAGKILPSKGVSYTLDCVENISSGIVQPLAAVGTEYAIKYIDDQTDVTEAVELEEPIYHVDLQINQ